MVARHCGGNWVVVSWCCCVPCLLLLFSPPDLLFRFLQLRHVLYPSHSHFEVSLFVVIFYFPYHSAEFIRYVVTGFCVEDLARLDYCLVIDVG